MKSLTQLIIESLNGNKAIEMCIKEKKPFLLNTKDSNAAFAAIKAPAQSNEYTIISIDCKKAKAEDFGGIPYADKNKKVGVATPQWAEQIIKNKNKKFIVFFDGICQLDADALNALMPIVLDNKVADVDLGDNTIICASCGDINKLSKPLLSKLKPVIKL